VQSHLGEIHLLPALPVAWKNGSVKGLKARGGYIIDITWKNGKLTHADIHSPLGTTPKVRIGDEKQTLDLSKDKRIKLIK
jgi:alpha-L-fucosidase 2